MQVSQRHAQLAQMDIAPLDSAIDTAVGIEKTNLSGPFSIPASEPMKAKQTVKSKAAIRTTSGHRMIQIHPTTQPKHVALTKVSQHTGALHKRFVVQVASFAKKTAAQKFANRINKSGFHAIAKSGVLPNHHRVTRVYVVPQHKGRQAAEKLNQQLFKQHRINGYIRKASV